MYKMIEAWIAEIRDAEEDAIALERIEEMRSKVVLWLETEPIALYQEAKAYFLIGLTESISKNYIKEYEALKKAFNLIQINKEWALEAVIIKGFMATSSLKLKQIDDDFQEINEARVCLSETTLYEEQVSFELRVAGILMDQKAHQDQVWPYINGIHAVLSRCSNSFKAKAYNQIGLIYILVFHNMIGSIFYLQKALEWATAENLIELEAELRGNIGICYTSLKQECDAITYLRPLLDDVRYGQLSDLQKYRGVYSLIINCLYAERFEEATRYMQFMDTLELMDESFEKKQLQVIRYLCKCYYYMMIPETALEKARNYILKARRLYEEDKKTSIFINIETILDKIEGDVLCRLGEIEKAYEIHSLALEKSIKYREEVQIQELYKRLANDYEKMGDFESATKCFKRYMNLNQSWFEKQKEKYTEILLKENEIESKESRRHELSEKRMVLTDWRNRDTLTSVFNRRFLNEVFENKFISSQDYPFTVLMLDVDCFKNYNDHYGHVKGDEVLRQIGHMLKEVFPKEEQIVGRYGGEEFIVLLPRTELAYGIKLGNQVNRQMAELSIEHAYSHVSDYVTLSIGISHVSEVSNTTYLELVEEADEYLYHAKRSGKNRVVYDRR